MNDWKVGMLGNSWKRFPWLEREERALDTLTAFVRDAEHELISVITALQAHIDLLQSEVASHQINADRFLIVNRTIARLIDDTNVLVSISELAQAPQSNQKQFLQGLMLEIASETQAAFSNKQVSLSCEIAKNATLIGKIGPLKLMMTGMLLSVLHHCHKLETVRIVGQTTKRIVSLSFDVGMESSQGVFKPWELGELRLMPLNGEGIGLAAVDAIARLHHGQLTVRTVADQRDAYRLNFRV